VLATVSGDGHVIELDVPTSNGAQFYRLRVLP
jgi:hypothetical protein